MDVDKWNATYGHKSRGLAGRVDDGDSRHPKHSYMVRQVGLWLSQQAGVFIYATGTGRWTGGPTYGTPGIADLVGWRVVQVIAEPAVTKEEADGVRRWLRRPLAEFLAVECKVGKDKLNPAQKEFRKEAEAAGVHYFLAEWDGKDKDMAAEDLKAQWKDGAALAAAEGERADG